MPKTTTLIHALSVGEVGNEALSRIDLERTRLAAETQSNLLPKIIGSAFFRPGFEYITQTPSDNFEVMKRWTLGSGTGAIMHISDYAMQFSVNGSVVTRGAVSSTVTSGDFSSGTGWTLTTTSGATGAISGGVLTLSNTARGSTASCAQAVSTSNADEEHAMRVTVTQNSVFFKIGSSSGDDDLLFETELSEGEHSLAFTPTSGTYYITITSANKLLGKVTSCEVESAGEVVLSAPWAEDDLRLIRCDQSANVMFIACDGYQQMKIERRSDSSWSLVKYYANDGPFHIETDADIKISSSELEGTGTLTSTRSLFKESMVGAIIRRFSDGQHIKQTLGAEAEYTDSIKVTGIGETSGGGRDDRDFYVTTTGTWSATVRVQRSFDVEDFGFTNHASFTTQQTDTAFKDDADNSIYYYRVGIDAGEYTSGTITVNIQYDGGGGAGIARITGYNSSTSVDVEILEPFNRTRATPNWREGEWSSYRGYPSGVTFYDGRLCWGGFDRFWASASDAYYSLDEDNTDDGGPIIRNIATGGGLQKVKWMLPLQRLILGTDTAEVAVKSSNFDEPITPTAVTFREISDYGSSDNVAAVKLNNNGLFVDRSETRLVEIAYDGSKADYGTQEISKINRDILRPGVVSMAVQRRPDPRCWIVLSDGSCIVLTYDRSEEIVAFTPVVVGGNAQIEDVCVIPGPTQDHVYAVAKLTIDGSVVRYRVKLALDDEVVGGNLNKQMDFFATGTNDPASTTINVGNHLKGEEVVVWADGSPLSGSYTVDAAGNITVGTAVTDWVAGLAYTWKYKSAKLAYASGMGTAINQMKRVNQIGLQLVNTHNAGVQHGRDFDNLMDLPQSINHVDVSNTIHETYDYAMMPHDGAWDTDSRVCLQGSSPYPATVSGIAITVTTHDKG